MTRLLTLLLTSTFTLLPLAACGLGNPFGRAGMDVRTVGGTPTQAAADARPMSEPQPAAGPTTPASGSPAVVPISPTPTPEPEQTEPKVAGPKLMALTGFIVASNQVSLTFGARTDWTRVQVRRLLGETPPECSSGTIVKDVIGPFNTPIAFTDETGIAAQSYTYRACFYDEKAQVTASEDKPTAITKPQIMFITSPTVMGDMGGSAAAADKLCAPYALRSPRAMLRREESWQAVLSDSHLNASVRIRVLGPIVGSDYSSVNSYHTLFPSLTEMWSTGLSPTSGAVLDTTGNATQSPVWTGSDQTGAYIADRACTDWSSSSSSLFGHTGDASTLSGQGWLNGGGIETCDQQRAIYCIAQPKPMLEAVTSITEANSIDLTIAPPAQWSADGYILVRRRAAAAGLPSATCDSPLDTPIYSAHPLSVDKIEFTDTMAAPNTAYNYSACLLDQDGNLIFSTPALYIVSSP
jgi:hypothetical protein